MRFKKFLLEQEDPVKEIIKLFKTDYSDAYKLETALYRGLSNHLYKPYEIRTKDRFTTPRKQKGLKPFAIETMFEICPEWKKFPDRTKSFIFTVNKEEADFFNKGGIVRVFPKNGAKIAIAPTDFNYYNEWPMIEKYELKGISYDFAYELIPQCYILCSEIFDIVDMPLISGSSRTRNWFEKNFKTIFEYFSKHYVGKDVEKEFKKIIGTEKFKKENEIKSTFDIALSDTRFLKTLTKDFNGDLEKMCKTLFSPDNNEFDIITTNQLDKHPKKLKSELWTTDECLIMSEETVEVIERAMNRG